MAQNRDCDYVHRMKVHQIMTAHARCVAPDNTLVEAAGLMRQLDVGALPVCEHDRIAGMVTDRDIVLRGVADALQSDTATVSQVMSSGAFFVFADQDIEEAAEMMEEKQIRRLPVLSRDKKMVGILSLGDLAVNANPAFSGMALKEVSQSPEGRMQGGKTDGANHRAAVADRATAKRRAQRASSTTRRTRSASSKRSRSTTTRGQRSTAGRGKRAATKRSR
jgi:CBS domain-containing protein